MVARSAAAKPTPWSRNLKPPKIAKTAFVHSFSNVQGDVRIGANVLIAAGTNLRADEGTPFHIGDYTNIQDGVIIHGLAEAMVLGDDEQEYSVFIGQNASITHMALIHGPAYIGDDCFIGFRSTVFNARVGAGSIVMMHALIQDVEIPPGKFVPSGAIITTQQQADRLPDVQPQDREFTRYVMNANDSLRGGYFSIDKVESNSPLREESTIDLPSQPTQLNNNKLMALTPDILDQIRSLIAQGAKISTELADQRRFRSNAWNTGPTITGSNINQVVANLEAIVAENAGQYVRLIGIDPNAKRRLLEAIISRPGETFTAPSVSSSASGSSAPTASTGADLGDQVRSLLAQGCRIGLEAADQRRFRANAWSTAVTLDTTQVAAVLRDIDAFCADFAGQYVRLIGIDPAVKRRVVEQIIQRPDGRVATGSTAASTSVSSAASASYSSNGSGSLNAETVTTIKQLLAQGFQIGTEHADPRRYRVNSWNSCSPIASSNTNEVVAALEACLKEHSGEYVRLIGIDTNARRRVQEMLIQKP